MDGVAGKDNPFAYTPTHRKINEKSMYKLYKTGKEFLDENLKILRRDPLGAIFFEGNATAIGQCDANNFAARVEIGGDVLLAIHLGDYPLVVYGSEACARGLARVVAENKLQFVRVIGYYDIVEKFLTEYEEIVGGSHKVNLSMDIMYCDKVTPCDTSDVEQATAKDVEEITRMYAAFLNEALGENATWGEKNREISKEIDFFALLKICGEIVSIGSQKESGYGLQRISNVYTRPQFRNKGYSRKIVTYLTEKILKSGDLPCLFVDQHNPVSNHLYQKIGYEYGKSRYEMEHIK